MIKRIIAVSALCVFPLFGGDYTIQDFQRDNAEDGPFVLMFGWKGCPPCEKVKPIIAKLQQEFEGRVFVAYIDKYKDETKAVYEFYSGEFSGVPYFISVNSEGYTMDETMGQQSYLRLKSLFKKALKKKKGMSKKKKRVIGTILNKAIDVGIMVGTRSRCP